MRVYVFVCLSHGQIQLATATEIYATFKLESALAMRAN